MDEDAHAASDGGADPLHADALHQGMEHLQQMAADALAAARAFIDAAEKVVADPDALEAVVHTVAGFARTAGESFAGMASGFSDRPTPGPVDDPPDDDGFESIRVS